MPYQYRPQWSVPGAGASESVLHFFTGSAAPGLILAAVRQFYVDVAVALPNDVTISFPSELTLYNTITGQLEQVLNVPAPASVTGQQAGGWAGGVGGLVVWESPAIVSGKRQKGRTFIVPLGGVSYEANGTLTASVIGILAGAGVDLLAGLNVDGNDLVVWSRTHGAESQIAEVSVPDRTAILRERRDE